MGVIVFYSVGSSGALVLHASPKWDTRNRSRILGLKREIITRWQTALTHPSVDASTFARVHSYKVSATYTINTVIRTWFGIVSEKNDPSLNPPPPQNQKFVLFSK